MTRRPFSRRRIRSEKSEQGQALILAIVFLLIFSLLLTALLSGVGVNLNMTAVTNDQSQLQYAADAGIEWGVNQLEQSGNACNSGNQIAGTPFYPVLGNGTLTDGSTPFALKSHVSGSGNIATTVYCEPMTGLGSGVFGGYSVVTGMNYPAVTNYPTVGSGSQEYAGRQVCTSLSGDPVESGASTYASQVTLSSGTQTSASPPNCVSYPTSASGGTPLWFDTNFAPDASGSPVVPGTVNHAVAASATDIYAVGAPANMTVSGAGSTTKMNATITSPLFTGSASYGGLKITDSEGALAQNTTIKAGSENNSTHTAQVMPNPTATAATDIFSIAGAAAAGIYHFEGEDDFSYIGATAPTTTFNGVWAPIGDANHVWIVGNGGTLLTCTSAVCSDETATWGAQSPGTTQTLNAITGTSTSSLWAVGAGGTLLSTSNGGLTWAAGKLAASGIGSTTLNSKNVSSPIFFSTGIHKGWAITDTAGVIPPGTTIATETTNGQAVLSNNATASLVNADTFTLSPTGSGTGSTTAGQAKLTSAFFTAANQYIGWTVSDTAGAIPSGTRISASAAGSATLSVNATLTTAANSDTFTLSPTASGTGSTTAGQAKLTSSLFTAANQYLGWTVSDTAGAIAPGTKINASAAGSATLSSNATLTTAANSDTITLNSPTNPAFTAVNADSSGNVWAGATEGTAGTSGLIAECLANCAAPAAAWNVINVAPTNVAYAGITTSGGSVWAVGGTSIASCAAACASGTWSVATEAGDSLKDVTAADSTDVWTVGSNPVILGCSGSCAGAGASWASQAMNDVESALNTVVAVPAALRTNPPSWGGSVWAAGAVPTGAPPPGKTLGTGWLTYSPPSTSSSVLLELKGGNVLNGGILNAVTPMKVDSGNFVQYYDTSVNAGGTCPSQSGNLLINSGTYKCATSVSDANVSPLLTLDEPLPSECSSSATCTAAGITTTTTGLAQCVTVIIKAPSTPICTDQSNTGITITPNSGGCTSFKEYFPGYYSKVPAISSTGTTYFASGVYYFAGGGSGALGNDATPGYVIGGQPGPGDVPTVVTNSPCWPYISSHFASLDSHSGTGWYEGTGGFGSPLSPNGTGVSWIFGNQTWFDIHTIDFELFTREVPAYTGLGPTAPQTISQEKNEGTFGVTLREIPPMCGNGVPAAGSDGAVHPGPYCVTSASNWQPLNPGLKNQALQIDANKHNPFVYIHGAIYMPDNNVTLFTNSPLRDVWVGALDVNSLELTFSSTSSPPIQVIGGGSPQVSKVELISQAQDPLSNTTVWEEAIVTEPPFGATQTGTKTDPAAPINGSSVTSALFTPGTNYVGFTIAGNGIPPNTTIVSEDTTLGKAVMSNASSFTGTEPIQLIPIPTIQSWRYCNGGGTPSPSAFLTACKT